jgi:hypothetical protein
MVSTTLDVGSRGGWVRSILYNQNGVEVGRRTGTTGMGDDGTGISSSSVGACAHDTRILHMERFMVWSAL